MRGQDENRSVEGKFGWGITGSLLLSVPQNCCRFRSYVLSINTPNLLKNCCIFTYLFFLNILSWIILEVNKSMKSDEIKICLASPSPYPGVSWGSCGLVWCMTVVPGVCCRFRAVVPGFFADSGLWFLGCFAGSKLWFLVFVVPGICCRCRSLSGSLYQVRLQ